MKVIKMDHSFSPIDMEGLTARSFSRLCYEYKGEVGENGDLFIEFDNILIRLTSEPPYDCLAIRVGSWVDPFEGKMTDENVQFIEKHGKYILKQCDTESLFKECVGHKVQYISELKCRSGVLVGLGIYFEHNSFYFYIDCDESYVDDSIPEYFVEV